MSSTSNTVSALNRKFTLNNGIKMPAIGMGTFRIRSQDDITKVVDEALQVGYRMFDTAAVYGNEGFLKSAFHSLLPKYNLKREDIFITTKLAPSDHGGGEITKRAYYASLDCLGMDCVDLYLIHWPGSAGMTTEDGQNVPMRHKTWGALAELYKSGRIKAIGVSNYTVRHLKELLANDYGVKPTVNQVEWHPYYYQPELQTYCQENGIVLQAYCSLGGTSTHDRKLINEPSVLRTADKLNVSPTQVLLRWALQQNVAIIPKSTSPKHIKENISLDFVIPEDDLREINGLNASQTKYAWNPSTVC